ncbi:SGNH/GDSL hydrolase family protein [Umezawaea sp. Da 62-37]|uniref:SGNH/GDSL hydrolase family protein n=1 Tax=Umezawaea sp. Da 62-37 TaxID=3075927 RepID=UPI0028F743AC|nr:SGNH/GDSL hydrolase family protein [Umezawaea sp. Da 62-37]WNV83816.1 SGNH/GDSL hydrolase family protein [Umezawaea sp. Da 62-37]
MGIAAALVFSLVMVPAPVAPEYAALGDSYAAGVGTGSSSGGCGRTAFAYPNLWKDAHGPASFQFPACSGATVGEVLERQLPALTPETGLVTLTVGGDDIGFSDVMSTCALKSDRDCKQAVDQAGVITRDELPGRLSQLFAAVERASPGARTVLLGYPRLFEPGSCPDGLSEAKRTAVNAGADLLADVTRSAADRAGVTYVDMRQPFAGHGLCSAESWLGGVADPVEDSYHPTKQGQVAYLRALESAVG